MKVKHVLVGSALMIVLVPAGFGQATSPPLAGPTPLPKISELLSKNLKSNSTAVSRERREMAYAKLLEGQRHVWRAGRLRSQAAIANTSKLARRSFTEALELDATLGEAYTALAELALNIQPGDIDEAISLAELSLKVAPNNFGAHRILARLYAFKSKLNTRELDPLFAKKAVTAWETVTRLDPRNAEGWAFLAAFHERSADSTAQIDALRKWLGAAPPIETQFYNRFMGGSEDLSPERASLKLGPALLKAGHAREAIETLSVVVADNPEDPEAIELLREAIASVPGNTAAIATEALEQAVFANPDNLALIELLAQTYKNAGRLPAAVDLLTRMASHLQSVDRESASMLHLSLGDIYTEADRVPDALAAYEAAFASRGISDENPVTDDDREFAMLVFEKMIQSLKAANRSGDVQSVIDRARRLLGKEDLFADRQLISLFRESGNRRGALDAVRAVRARMPEDYGFLRLEATLLTESGQVDEAVALVRKLIDAKPKAPTSPAGRPGNAGLAVVSPSYDDFSNFLFISNLYSYGNRGKEAADAANQAYAVARGAERKQIARLTLATALQMAKDFAGAEETLRNILKDSPGNPIALNNLGYFLLERRERYEEALGLIEQAVRVDPTNPSYLDSLGWAHFKLGRLDEAEKRLKEAARFDSGSATIQEHLGDVYEKKGQTQQARTAWEKALKLASDSADLERLKAKLGATK